MPFFFGLVRAVNQFEIFENTKIEKLVYRRDCWIYGKNNKIFQQGSRGNKRVQVHTYLLDLRLKDIKYYESTEWFIHTFIGLWPGAIPNFDLKITQIVSAGYIYSQGSGARDDSLFNCTF